jgi:hypothetical protein
MLPAVDPVTVAVVGALVVFTVRNRLRWQSKLAWLRRVQLEHLARTDEDGEPRRAGDDPGGESEGTRRQDVDSVVEVDDRH